MKQQAQMREFLILPGLVFGGRAGLVRVHLSFVNALQKRKTGDCIDLEGTEC